jgi:RimJ/RimL family protein N-acetyltransferase
VTRGLGPRADGPAGLDDGTLCLRSIDEDDAVWVAGAVVAGETCCLGPRRGPLTEDDAREMIASWQRMGGEGNGLALAAQVGSRLVGLLVLQMGGPGDVEVAYWIATQERGNGYAARAVRLVSHWLVDAPGVHRVWLETDLDNLASQRVAEKAGFVREGIARDHCERDGTPHDCVIYVSAQGVEVQERAGD